MLCHSVFADIWRQFPCLYTHMKWLKCLEARWYAPLFTCIMSGLAYLNTYIEFCNFVFFYKTSDNFVIAPIKLKFNISIYIFSRCWDAYILMPFCISNRAPGPLRDGSAPLGEPVPELLGPRVFERSYPLSMLFPIISFVHSLTVFVLWEASLYSHHLSSVLKKMIRIGLYEIKSNNGFIFVSLFSSPSVGAEFVNFFQLTEHRTRR